MRWFRLMMSVLVFVLPAAGALPQTWSLDSADDFLSGELDGLAVTSRGELAAAPLLVKIAALQDPFVFATAADGGGSHYLATGNGGKVYRLRGGKIELLFSAPEPEVYAIAWAEGALFVGTSPKGKVYRIDPSTGVSTVWFDPDDAYIWAIAPAPKSGLMVATGLPGRLYRVSGKGTGEVWFEAPEPHIRSLGVRSDGTVLVGGSGQGGIYEVSAKGRARALFDSELSEISAIAIDPRTGVAWAAAATSALPATPPPQGQAPTQGNTAGSSSGASDAQQQNQGSVEISFSFDDQQTSSSTPGGSGELYRIDRDGYVERVWKFDREIVYAIGASGDYLLLSTGPQGRLYRYREGELTLFASVAEKQIVSYSSAGGRETLTTTNGGAVYELRTASASEQVEYRSPVKDTGGFSRFGQYRIEGSGLGQSSIEVSFRSGNTAVPDSTWGEWSRPSTQLSAPVSAPAARYLQFRLRSLAPPASSRIDEFSVSYLNRNAAPLIDSLSVNDPGVVFITTAFPSPPGVVEATNPDENGIFTSLDTPSARNDPGKRYHRKGYRTLNWRARDPNGDTLRFDLFFRKVGETKWLRLRSDIRESQYNFDASQLPDGRYEVRLVASDEPDNPDAPMTASREGVLFDIDNTMPRISVTTAGDTVEVHVTDDGSPLVKAEYSIDAAKWVPLNPQDGILDGKVEVFRMKLADLRDRFVMIRVVDASFNVATARIP